MDEIQGMIGNGMLIAVIAHGLIGISLLWDKVLLQEKATKNLVSYVFWLGAISVFGLVLLGFGFRMPSLKVAGIAFAAGIVDLIASYFYYRALQAGEASESLAAMGGFAPVATALIAIPLLDHPLGGDLAGFAVMTAGGFLMFFAEKQSVKKMLPPILLAASGYGLTAVLQKIVFENTNFVSGYVFFTVGTTVGALAMLIPRGWRQQIFSNSAQAPARSKFWYMFNRFLAGLGSFLVVFAVSKTSPALVSAISGVRYVIIFVGAYGITKLRPQWFQEDFRAWPLTAKLTATGLVIVGLILVGMNGGSIGGAPQ